MVQKDKITNIRGNLGKGKETEAGVRAVEVRTTETSQVSQGQIRAAASGKDVLSGL